MIICLAMEVNIFDYQNPRRFLLDYLSSRQKQDSTFSMRKWAKEMGLNSNALLVMLLNGRRPIKLKHTSFLLRGLSFTSQEKLYFQALVQYESSSSIEEKELSSLWLSTIHPGKKGVRIREVEEYHIVAHWIHSAILSLCQLPSFDGSVEMAFKLLQKQIPPNEIRSAIERLIEFSYLERLENGKLLPCQSGTSTKDDIPNTAILNHHKEAIKKAYDTLEMTESNQRELRSFSFVMSKDKMEQAKNMIRKFQIQLEKALISTTEEKEKDPEMEREVYQYNVQFFQITKATEKTDSL